jgi:hypothetical protein
MASTALANSTRRPSPVVLTIRPRCRSAAIDNGFSNGFQPGQRAFFVAAHQAAVACDIRRQHRRQSSRHALFSQESPKVRIPPPRIKA